MKNPFPDQIAIEYRFEVGGEILYVRQVIEAHVYDSRPEIREEVHRKLRQRAAEEIMKRYPYEIRVHR